VPVSEKLSSGLTGGAIVGFIRSVTNALNLCAATRAGLFAAAMNGHAFAKGRHVSGKLSSGLATQAVGRARQRYASRIEEAMNLRYSKLLGERQRRKLRLKQDFIRIRIANAAKNPRIGEGALQRVICEEQRSRKACVIRVENFDATGSNSRRPASPETTCREARF